MAGRIILIAICSVVAFSLPALAREDKLQVVASFSIIADLARNVGKDRIDLAILVGADGDAHAYEPRPADAATIARADVVLVNGLGLEGFVQRLVSASATRAAIVEVSTGAELLSSGPDAHDGHDHQGAFDPHAWQSVGNAQIYVQNIVRAFCQADRAGCENYQANARVYLAQLDRLEEEIHTAIARVPQARRVVITPHDAFRYFAHAYGIRFLAPEGVSTDSEASAADVAALIRQIRAHRASAVFIENVSDPRLIEQIARETDAVMGGVLYSDALSGPDGPAPSYIDMMRHNARTIVAAILGG